MTLAIMQPYFLPYLGYFQLMAAVDKFVIYDDVAYIQRGWINRNRFDLQGRPHLLTIPVKSRSQNRRINELELVTDRPWRKKVLRTLEHAYRRAPNFHHVFPLICKIVEWPENNLARYLQHSLLILVEFLSLKTNLVPASSSYSNQQLKGQARIIDICLREKAAVYVNPAAGRELYDSAAFLAHGIALRFLQPKPGHYRQRGEIFLPSLSIADVLMWNSRPEVDRLLHNYQFLS